MGWSIQGLARSRPTLRRLAQMREAQQVPRLPASLNNFDRTSKTCGVSDRFSYALLLSQVGIKSPVILAAGDGGGQRRPIRESQHRCFSEVSEPRLAARAVSGPKVLSCLKPPRR